ncbi:hypothetical protein AB0C76_32885 [Kitasatospora sp. NPDC048722]|uniref:hypothetical protein n=1 Tax=Kitasatospora sp. NPDC048722 TaxID=3155639 RepID=UPI0033DF7D64
MATDLRPHLDALLATLGGIKDPIAREVAARELLDDLLPATVKEAKQIRREAVEELRSGRTLKQVGELLGLSTARVDQILKGR